MKQAIMIGAGNIGRGFIGAILSRSGYHVTFADVNMTLIDAINAEGRYTVHIQDRNPAAFTITNIDGISSAGPELASALRRLAREYNTNALDLRPPLEELLKSAITYQRPGSLNEYTTHPAGAADKIASILSKMLH